jgi:hypothetical protein
MKKMIVADRGFESQAGQIEDYKISICCLSAKHAALRRKSKDWFARNLDNVCEWADTWPTHDYLVMCIVTINSFSWDGNYSNN